MRKLERDEREQRAREAATLVCKSYPAAREAAQVVVVFVRHIGTRNLRFTDSTDGHRFTPAELLADPDPLTSNTYKPPGCQ